MNLYSPREIKNILNKYNIRPRKSLGQNFVINKNVIDKIVETADLKPSDAVLEIGPGIGTLTIELAKRVKKIIAVEKDKNMCEVVKNVLNIKGIKNVEIIHGDILKLTRQLQNLKAYKLVANIPYYITQPIIRLFLEAENPPKEIVLLIQKEVAQRICAKPPRMNLLAVSVQFYAKPEIVDYVSKNNFWPMPKVDSAIIKISRINTNIPQISRIKFFKVVRAGFSSPRKMLINNLSKQLGISKEELKKTLKKIGINAASRAENLSIGEWTRLTNETEKSKKQF